MMRLFGIVSLGLLFVILVGLFVGLFFVVNFYPTSNIAYEPYSFNTANYIISNSSQFYSNMRYKDSNISYFIEDDCSDEKRSEVLSAFAEISAKTILTFYQSSEKHEIKIYCSEISPTPQEEGHFVAGEGGPSEILNTTLYAVILSGKISLYRDDECKQPKIAPHEILHALGFDHNSN